MQPLTVEQVDQVLLESGIRVATPTGGIGRELTYRRYPRRIVVVHFADDEALEYLLGVMSRVLELDEEWLLLTRYGSVSDLDLVSPGFNLGAIAFAEAERSQLAEYLCMRPKNVGSISADLYALGRGGRTLVTWDHHTAEEGLGVKLQSVADTTRLLVSLNEFGAELELLYSDG